MPKEMTFRGFVVSWCRDSYLYEEEKQKGRSKTSLSKLYNGQLSTLVQTSNTIASAAQ